MNKSDILWHEVYNLVPRVLGLMDRDPNSYTFGCLDRYYWHYKLHDFANARLQDGGWLLALVYGLNVSGNRFYMNRKIAEWALGCIDWWRKIQHRNGSFDELYPYECSFCASVFSTWWIAETFLELKRIDRDKSVENRLIHDRKAEEIVLNLRKAGNWIIRNHNLEVGNQQAAAIAALATLYQVTEDERYLLAAKKKLYELINIQDESGFYPEYGGPDIGYHSLTMTCLFSAKMYMAHIADDPLLCDSLEKGLNFLSRSICANGTYNWWETSRRTQYLYPYSFLSSATAKGIELFERFVTGLNNYYVLRPTWIDDRFCTFFAIDYIRTYMISRGISKCC